MQIQFKLLTSILLFFISGTICAQGLSIVGGGNYSDVAVSSAKEKYYEAKFGFHAGAYLDYVLKKDKSNELVVETGLLFDSKGAVQEQASNIGTIKYNTTLYYADIPLYFKYRYRFRSLHKVYVGAGPYIGVGLFGNINATIIDESQKENVRWGSNVGEDHFKRLDYGLSARAGFLAVGGLDFSFSYDYGIPNISVISKNDEIKSRMMRLSVGYHFSLTD
jgi:hypothetical protein